MVFLISKPTFSFFLCTGTRNSTAFFFFSHIIASALFISVNMLHVYACYRSNSRCQLLCWQKCSLINIKLMQNRNESNHIHVTQYITFEIENGRNYCEKCQKIIHHKGTCSFIHAKDVENWCHCNWYLLFTKKLSLLK